MKKNLLIILLLVSFFSFSQGIQQSLDSVFQTHQLMGMSVTAVCKGEIIFNGNYGLADYERNIPVSDSTLYRVASISKSITATALMVLWDQGLFDLDDDISSYLGFEVRNPYYPAASITFRMLLSHTSCITDGPGYSSFLNASYEQAVVPSLAEILVPAGEYYSFGNFLQKYPGTYFTYSNLNYVILGTLVEKLSQQRFDLVCKSIVFDPLGLEASFLPSSLNNISNLAVLYRFQGGEWAPQADDFGGVLPAPPISLQNYIPGTNAAVFAPQGGLRISATDLTKFMLLHANKGILNQIRILSDSAASLMQTPAWVFNGNNGDNYYGLFKSWGLGFHLSIGEYGNDQVFPSTAMVGHPGEAYGLVSDMYFDPVQKSGLVFVTNGCKTNYFAGLSSAFYAQEEGIFQTVFEKAVNPCLLSGLSKTKPAEIGLVFNRQTGEIEFGNRKGKAKLEIFNIQGIMVFKQFLDMQNTFEIGRLADGLYVLRLQTGNDVLTGKIKIE